MKTHNGGWGMVTLVSALISAFVSLLASALVTSEQPLDHALLVLAYQIEQLRWWIIEVAFLAPFDGINTLLITPLLGPLVTLALIIAGITIAVAPITGVWRVRKIRQILLVSLLAPVMMSQLGVMLVELERVRGNIGGLLFETAQVVVPQSVFGVPSTDFEPLNPKQDLYPATCGGTTLTRPANSVIPGGTVMHMDAVTAASLFVTACDIHLPLAKGLPDLPDAFAFQQPGGPGFVATDFANLDPVARISQISRTREDMTRTGSALLPSLLSMMEPLIQFMLTLAMVLVWISLPLALIIMLFQQDSSALVDLTRHSIQIVMMSWGLSVVLGILYVCVATAAATANIGAFMGMSVGGLIASLAMFRAVLEVFLQGLQAFRNMLAMGSRVLGDASQFMRQGSALAGRGISAATRAGGIGMAGMLVVRESGSGVYGREASIGRITPIARLGEVAQAMGYCTMEDSTTIRERRWMWSAGQDLTNLDQPGVSEPIDPGMTNRETDVAHVADDVGRENLTGMDGNIMAIPDQIGMGDAQAAGPIQCGEALEAVGQSPGAAVRAARLRQGADTSAYARNERRSTPLVINDQGKIVSGRDPDPGEKVHNEPLPAGKRFRRMQALLAAGHTVHDTGDGTISYWGVPPFSLRESMVSDMGSQEVQNPDVGDTHASSINGSAIPETTPNLPTMKQGGNQSEQGGNRDGSPGQTPQSRLTERQCQILSIIRTNTSATIQDFVDRLGRNVSKRSIQRDLKNLLQLNLIRIEGGWRKPRYTLFDTPDDPWRFATCE